ncbi:TetR/AcrR family transcriptional regulator [Pseudomonas gingeri NCPPB 3146 = LMG 5327]|uniref:TetR/AcrR family transcriptional regulator n=2 Tax=Pseudomonas gingeri TaxID=117681 RepID=A0A7Y7XUQ1_9PSED|nr:MULTISPECIES: TetR/AcrR family transcriptional regulator [Pseudomonas]NVZ29337.1 TetR/AcrR family transcriptional regulator [Pseudomonas gingeri]NVZ60560.1 TetR/AcrR family transcriptional regulator [Pseudomonas gingeri]NVZ73375.1 TetR/AcrR family transcriptional regulator [Pseudomonas gingeri]NWA03313.1 TetR/AcrR family transcriptional regulator [Pseudomonas gingeri]NWA14170.1 TetR/AcrR family transcriptional regulator [Pseudomonas gingeri]
MESLNPVQRRIHQAALRLFAEKGISQVNISDLAQEAGVARGTIYNNVETMDKLFEQVASQLSADMHQRVKKSIDSLEDPAQRLANGIRLFIRRTHEEPHWGAFMSRFALSNLALREMFSSQAVPDLIHGLGIGRYHFRQEQMVTIISFIASSVLGSMFLVLEGLKTWRDAGTDTAELILRALGVSIEDARVLATVELPPLPPSG